MSEKEKQSMEIPMMGRNARIDSYDEETRTARLKFATGSEVERFGFFTGPFIEQLEMGEGAIRDERLRGGSVPLLKDHDGYTVDNVIGRVLPENVDLTNGEASVQFGEREEIQGIVRDIVNGTIRNVSVGYRIHKFKRVEMREVDGEEIPVMRAVDWEPLEISAVAIGADPSAGFRSEKRAKVYKCEVIGMEDEDLKTQNRSEEVIETETETVMLEEDPKDFVESDAEKEKLRAEELEKEKQEKKQMDEKALEAARQEAELAERERAKGIRHVVRVAKLEDSFAEELINDGTSLDEARAKVIDALEKKDKETPTRSETPVITAENDDRKEVAKDAMRDAFLHRAMPEHYKLTDSARDFRGLDVSGMAKELLQIQGVDTRGMTKYEVAKRSFHTTSDFPEILANTMGKALRDEYERLPQTFEPFTTRRTVPDYKEQSRVQLGEGSVLEEVPEGGEIKHGTFGESAEKYSLLDFAKAYRLSNKTILNNDLDSFTRIPAALGARARDLEADLVWGIITTNGAMADGNNLFSAAHSNIETSGAAPSVTTVGAGRAAMRAQLGIDGAKLNLRPSWLAVPVALETTAEQVTSSISPQQASNVNPFAPGGRTPLQIISEPRLDDANADGWYLFSSKDRIDMVELGMLEGMNGPDVTSEVSFESLGMKIRVVHTCQAKAIDWRGMYYNDGVT